MNINISVPDVLFPLIAHAVKFVVEHPDVILKSCKMELDNKTYTDFSPLMCCSRVHDYIHLRAQDKVVMEAVFSTKSGEHDMWIIVHKGISTLTFSPREE